MTLPYSNPHEGNYLTSWKEIASYMGKGVRTVQRYEALLGLPVRRPAGKTRAAVVATREEIDAWVTASPMLNTLRLPHLTDPRRDPRLAVIRQGIKEMHVLREQMTVLRRETHSSLSVFVASLESLRLASKVQNDHAHNVLEAAQLTSNNCG